MTAFLIMDAATAAPLQAQTAGAENRLEPREIVAGPAAGLFALPARVREAPAFAALGPQLAAIDVADLDPAEAWPVDEEMA